MRLRYFFARHRRTLQRTLVVACCCALAGSALWHTHHKLRAVSAYEFCFDETISPAACAFITQMAHGIGPSQLMARLHEECRFIKEVTVHVAPGGTGMVKLLAHKPLCTINEKHMLLANGTIVPRELIHEKLAMLPNVTANDWHTDGQGVPDLLPTCLSALGPELLRAYAVTWKSEHELLLVDNSCPTFAVITSADSALIPQPMVQYNRVKKLLESRGLLNTPRKARWFADVRFKNQVIVFSDAGGKGNGSRFI